MSTNPPTPLVPTPLSSCGGMYEPHFDWGKQVNGSGGFRTTSGTLQRPRNFQPAGRPAGQPSQPSQPASQPASLIFQ